MRNEFRLKEINFPRFFFVAFFLIVATVACHQLTDRPEIQNSAFVAALPSWEDGPAKEAVIDFVRETTDTANKEYIPANQRIVVFDNDGTLWSEQPAYFQFYFIMDRIRQLAPEHPEWKDTQPYKSAIEGDMEGVIRSGTGGLLTLTLATHTAVNAEDFAQTVHNWIDTARHPVTGKLLKQMVYQPMLEVLDYLRSNGFKTYIVSGGGIDFMRPWTEEVYGIPPEQVIGSSVKTVYELQDGIPVIMKFPEMEFFNDREAKPVSINKFIGRRPVAAFGNSDGDLAMLQYTAAGEGKNLMVYIHHTDSIREYAYDRSSHIGRLDRGLDEAMAKGWVVVDMKNDWKTIYPGN